MPKLWSDKQLTSVEPLAQVHDELVFQTPTKDPSALANECRRIITHMSPKLAYNDREFTLNVEMKVGRKWGKKDMIEITPEQIEQEGLSC